MPLPTQPPALATLTERFLRSTQAQDGFHDGTEVEPHEVLTGHRVDARAAWNDALLVAELLGQPRPKAATPQGWGATVQNDAPRSAVPICLGSYPQAVKDIGVILDVLSGSAPLARTRIGEQARATLTTLEQAEGFAANEQAADLWFAGDSSSALEHWQALPDSPVKSFNCGMALLFLGQRSAAKPYLNAAADALPESSGWSHLARLYLTLADMPA
jgi:hypothetical protein